MTQSKSKPTKKDAIASIPVKKKTAAPNKPRHCEHIMTNGEFCRAMALRGRRHCHFHLIHLGRRLRAERRYEIAMKNGIAAEYIPMDLPLLEDANSIQLALSHAVDALMHGSIDTKRAGLVLYALQTATLNLSNGVDFSPRADATVAEEYDKFEDDYGLRDGAPELKLDEAGERKEPRATGEQTERRAEPGTAQASPANVQTEKAGVATVSSVIRGAAPAGPAAASRAPERTSRSLPAPASLAQMSPAQFNKIMEILPQIQIRGGKAVWAPTKAGPGPTA